MGMVGYFSPVDESTLNELFQNPAKMSEFLYPENEDGEPEGTVEIDKSWHGIHFVLSGSADIGEGSLAQAVLDGQELVEEVAYGPARVHDRDAVRKIAQALSAVTPEDFAKNYNAKALSKAKVYPEIWDGDDDPLSYLLSYFAEVVTFYEKAAKNNCGAVLYLA